MYLAHYFVKTSSTHLPYRSRAAHSVLRFFRVLHQDAKAMSQLKFGYHNDC